MAKIEGIVTHWTPQGFGFASLIKNLPGVEPEKFFVHFSEVTPRIPASENITGRKFTAEGIFEAKKPGQNRSLRGVKLAPLSVQASVNEGMVTIHLTYFKGNHAPTVVTLNLISKDGWGKWEISRRQTEQARSFGVSEEDIKLAHEHLQKVQPAPVKSQAEIDLEAATSAAIALSKGNPEKAILIFSTTTPVATQWLDQKAIAAFNDAWSNFVNGLTVGGQNATYTWAIADKGAANLEVRGEYGRSYMYVKFGPATNISSLVRIGRLQCGESSHHMKYDELK